MKGQKTGGRNAGTPNKITKELREIIKDILDDNVEQIKKDFDSLKPKDRVTLYIDLLQYGLPKLQGVTIEAEILPYEIKFIDADGGVIGGISQSEDEVK